VKANQEKKTLTFGEFIMAKYDAQDRQRAQAMVWLAVNARLVEFRGPHRFLISERSPE
jgi:hypothetical protein